MKHQSPNLNTLPPTLPLRLRIHKRRMRHPPRTPINLRIKTLNQRNQLRRLRIAIIPLNPRVRLNSIRLALAVRVDELDADEVALRNRVCVGHGERVFQDCFYGSPYVYYLVSALKQLWGFAGQVVADPVLGCGVGLVDVYALDWAAELICAFVVARAADCVVEDEDF